MQQQTMDPMLQQQQQPIMMAPPNIITKKDLLYLKDIMSWLLDATKKCSHFSKECTDPRVKQAIDRAGQMHQRHYNLILKHCQNNNDQVMASMGNMGSQQSQPQ